MGIYIKGMEMPKPKLAGMATIYDAHILISPDGYAVIVVDNEDGLDSTEYPLVTIPRGRLINADALNYTMLYKENWMSGTGVEAPAVWKKDIDACPTIIPAEPEEEEIK